MDGVIAGAKRSSTKPKTIWSVAIILLSHLIIGGVVQAPSGCPLFSLSRHIMDHADDGDDVFVYMGGLVPEHLRETITHVRIHESIKIITRYAFQFCRNLVSIEMHDGVEIIEEYAFYDCTSLRGIKLPGVRVIEESAFYNCTALVDVEFGNKLETIGKFAFQYCGSVKNIKLPKVRIIQTYAFHGCGQLTEVKMSEDLERIELEAFDECPRLRRIAIPLKNNMMDKGGVFKECVNLSQVDLVGGTHKTISSLLVEAWRNEMEDEVDQINQDLPYAGRYEKTAVIQSWIARVLRRMKHYKRKHYALLKDAMLLLELALWKMRLQHTSRDANMHQISEKKSLEEEPPAKKVKITEGCGEKSVDTKETSKTDADAARHEAHVTCGASIIIPHVLSFLNDDDVFPVQRRTTRT